MGRKNMSFDLNTMEPAVKRLFLEFATQNQTHDQEESTAPPAPRFSEEDDSRLIELVQLHPILWDSRRSDYSSNHKKSAAWKTISEEMDMNTLNLRLRFSYLKRKFLNVYGRVKNAQLAGASDSTTGDVPEARLPWYTNMSYLLPVADNPNPRPASTRNNSNAKKAGDEWIASAFDILNNTYTNGDEADAVETTSNGLLSFSSLTSSFRSKYKRLRFAAVLVEWNECHGFKNGQCGLFCTSVPFRQF
jgi:hypothetical protein